MQKTMKIKVMEKCEISPSPPPHSNSQSLPLTFLDIPWLFFSPSQPLFFYEYPHSLNHFTSTTLPILKHSLSLTLHHFYPFASKLTTLHQNNKKPIILSSHMHDHVSLTVALAQQNQQQQQQQEAGGLILADHFFHLSSNYQREATRFHSLVPPLEVEAEEMETLQTQTTMVPLMSLQITVFPHSGICIGLSYHHVASDARTFNNFIKTWASYSNPSALTTAVNINKYLPTHDRTLIKDSHGLEDSFLYEWWNTRKAAAAAAGGKKRELIFGPTMKNDSSNVVRATFVVDSADIDRIKRWIVSYCMGNNTSIPIHLSPYVVTCAFLWVCWVKTHVFTTTTTTTTPQAHQPLFSDHDHTPVYFGFVAGGLTRLEYQVPASYFGNCVGFGRVRATKSELMGEDGIIAAANGIGNMVRKLDKTLFENAKTWISDWKVLSESELNLVVTGSPKVDLYDTDFGWGRPKKIEDISIDRTRNVSLHESRDVKGGIEVGLALSKAKMDVFNSLYTHGLKALNLNV